MDLRVSVIREDVGVTASDDNTTIVRRNGHGEGWNSDKLGGHFENGSGNRFCARSVIENLINVPEMNEVTCSSRDQQRSVVREFKRSDDGAVINQVSAVNRLELAGLESPNRKLTSSGIVFSFCFHQLRYWAAVSVNRQFSLRFWNIYNLKKCY